MTRRSFLALAATAAGCAARAGGRRSSGAASTVHTVTGPVPADRLGVTLMHEHVLVDFVGADRVSPDRYDAEHAFTSVLPHLEAVRALGCETLVECTPAYLGRDIPLLRRLSDGSGVRILTNTGYYGAARDKHLPRHAFTETDEQLATRWIREFERGIDGSGVRPGFMKIGVDESPLSEVDAKLVRAAALTHRETGLAIASHTGSGLATLEQLDILQAAGVPAAAFIWVHAQSEKDGAFHTRVARRGAWLEFDGVSEASIVRHVERVRAMRDEGFLDRVLVSHDAGWYRVGEPGGGKFRPYDTIFTTFVPALKAAGFGESDVKRLLTVNPARALSASERGSGS